jgi:hypothetical protein
MAARSSDRLGKWYCARLGFSTPSGVQAECGYRLDPTGNPSTFVWVYEVSKRRSRPVFNMGAPEYEGRDLPRDSLAYYQLGIDKRAGPFCSCGPNHGLKRSFESDNQRWT